MTERGGPMTPKAFHALFGRIGGRAKMPFAVHPHMLRHGCRYALANAGHATRALQAYLGHKNIQHTVRYTELAPDRFKNFCQVFEIFFGGARGAGKTDGVSNTDAVPAAAAPTTSPMSATIVRSPMD